MLRYPARSLLGKFANLRCMTLNRLTSRSWNRSRPRKEWNPPNHSLRRGQARQRSPGQVGIYGAGGGADEAGEDVAGGVDRELRRVQLLHWCRLRQIRRRFLPGMR